jgi:fatty-acyl-CoA synthase
VAALNLLFGLRAYATQRGHDVAIVDDVGAYTFAELWCAVEGVARRLRDAGARRGQVVAIAMEGSAAYIATVLGTMRAHATAAPLNTALTSPEIQKYLDVIDPALIVGDMHAWEGAHARANLIEIDSDHSRTVLADRLGLRAAKVAPLSAERLPSPETPAMLFPTGGTTGLPKAAMLSHRAALLWVMSMAGHGRAGSGIELYSLPFFHVGLLTGPMSTLHAGAQVIVQRRFDPERALERILADGASRLQTTPTIVRRLRGMPAFQKARLCIRQIRFGGMSSAPEFVDELLELFPSAQLSTGYGATEFGPVTCASHDDFLRGRRTGVGRPLPGVQVTIQDPAGASVAPGAAGDVVVQCPWQASGYVGRPEETAATFTSTGVRLADWGSMDEDGWVTLMGRRSEMLITGGENVFPAEVEAVLARHPDVADVVVVGMPDPTWGDRIEAVVVARAGARIRVDELRSFARAELAPFKLPRSVREIDAIPLTANNKPDRLALVRGLASGDVDVDVDVETGRLRP